MSTTKSEERTSRRRSSILKAPKTRQPLQNVELNASSVENSPTTSTHKMKRRVSFAEKKHVKEFCDSMEQGTVWDSTYEENELSQRNSHNSNDENVANVEFLHVSSKSSRATIASETSDESIIRSTCTSLQSRHSSSSAKNLNICDLNPPSAGCDPMIDNSVFGTAPTRIPYPANHFASIKARRSLSASDCFTERSDFDEKPSFRARAETSPSTIDFRTRQAVRDDPPNLESAAEAGEDRSNVVPTEGMLIGDSSESGLARDSIIAFADKFSITDASAIPSAEPMVDQKTARIAKVSVEHEKFTIFHDTSMEITEAVSNLAKEKESLIMKSSEESSVVTEIPTFKTVGRPSFSDFDRKEDLLIDGFPHRDQSMDFTEVVQTIPHSPTDRTNICNEKSADFVDMIGKVVDIENLQKSPTERTRLFHDKSMEFTDAIGNVRIMKLREKSPTERTKIFHDKSMEFTGAVENVKISTQRENSPTERTKIFHNEFVDFTEVVKNVAGIENVKKSPTERTKLFHHKSMEFTDAIGNVRIIKQREKSPTERTKIFHDKSMEFTDAVQNFRIMKQQEKSPPERTKIFQSESVDFTEVVRNLPSTDDLTKRESLRGHSTIFPNESLNSTEMGVEKSLAADPRPEKLSIFCDRSTSVEFNPRIEKSRHDDSLKQPETAERNISQICKPHEVPEVVQKIFRAPKLGSRELSYALDARMAIVAKTFIPPEQKPRSEEPAVEIRSPLPKRMKSIGNKSTDLTAAVDFIKLREKKTQPLDESSYAGSTLIPTTIGQKFSETITDFQNKSMETTEVVAESFPRKSHSAQILFPSAEAIPIFQNKMMETNFILPVSADCDDDPYQMRNTTLLGDESMEITGVIPGVVRAGNIVIEEDPKTTLFHDQSMEITAAVSRPALSRSILTSNETRLPDDGETGCTVFRDDSMELTGAVHSTLRGKEQICANKNEAVHWENPRKFDHDGKTVFFRDDRMELTGAVGFNSRAEALCADKENCPVGVANFRPRGGRLFEDENQIAFKSEYLDKGKSFRCSSSQRNEKKHPIQVEPEKENRVGNFASDDITGVVAFSSQIDNEYEGGAEEQDFRISGNDSRTLILGNESLEMTGVVPWSPDVDVNRLSGPTGETNDLPIIDKIPQRSSQIVKELFQQPIPNDVSACVTIEPKSVNERTGMADLEAEIRKLAESFALEDESGFDQATFLRQQAQCMEDYEANSTASQDFQPPTQSVRANVRSASEESFESEKFDDWERNAKNATAAGGDASAAETQCFSSKSLEELRNRAYSVGKFQPEATGYELTAAISMPSSDEFHRTIMLEDLQAVEPPSFLEVLADSVRSARSITELLTESGIGGKTAEGVRDRDREAILRISDDMLNTSLDTELAIPDITETVNIERIVKERRYGEEKEGEKKSIYDARITGSSSEINDERTKNHRRSSSGLTTADEFSSESADGPSEKLRRGESILPIGDNVAKSTKLTRFDRSWNSKNFASSTVIIDDLTRQMMHQTVEESSVVADVSLSDELPSAINATEEKNDDRSVCAEESMCDVAMEATASLCKTSFEAFQEIINDLAERLETIWTIIRFDEKMLALHFFSNSIVLAIHFNETSDAITNPIKVINFLSQLIEEGTDPGVSLAHSLIMKKVDSVQLTRSCQTYEDIPQMLEFVTTEVKLGMDFMFELDRLRNRNVMEICGNRIIFIVRTTDINAGIILKLTMEIKPFAEINSNDISISCILGYDKVRENDIKRLITKVKRDYRFLRFYMNDVKDYIDLMAETGFSASDETGCE